MLVDPPVNAQAVLFLLHASFTPAVVQRTLLQRVQGTAALVPGLQAGQHAGVALFACHTLPHGPILGAAPWLLQAQLTGSDAVQPAGRSEHRLPCAQQHICVEKQFRNMTLYTSASIYSSLV